MKETIFQNEIRTAMLFLFPDCFYHKLKDDAIFKGSKTRFSPKKPFDSFFVKDGKSYAIETKQVKSPVPFQMVKLKKHQIDNLKRFESAGGTSYIMINYRYPGYNVVFVTNIKVLEAIADELEKQSIPLEILENDKENILKITRKKINGVTVWDLRPLFEQTKKFSE